MGNGTSSSVGLAWRPREAIGPQLGNACPWPRQGRPGRECHASTPPWSLGSPRTFPSSCLHCRLPVPMALLPCDGLSAGQEACLCRDPSPQGLWHGCPGSPGGVALECRAAPVHGACCPDACPCHLLQACTASLASSSSSWEVKASRATARSGMRTPLKKTAGLCGFSWMPVLTAQCARFRASPWTYAGVILQTLAVWTKRQLRPESS
mmetsp:Transcript_47173/g.106065  ORF Transcript_47173/g.106065 Transcript_47173/m.106065 type:complete len:208 (+) Transcript_47173:255-878(+)